MKIKKVIKIKKVKDQEVKEIRSLNQRVLGHKNRAWAWK